MESKQLSTKTMATACLPDQSTNFAFNCLMTVSLTKKVSSQTTVANQQCSKAPTSDLVVLHNNLLWIMLPNSRWRKPPAQWCQKVSWHVEIVFGMEVGTQHRKKLVDIFVRMPALERPQLRPAQLPSSNARAQEAKYCVVFAFLCSVVSLDYQLAAPQVDGLTFAKNIQAMRQNVDSGWRILLKAGLTNC